MKQAISVVLCLLLALSLAACGAGDALKGTWVQANTDYGTVTWTFDGKGACSLETDYMEKTAGTYTLADNGTVTVKIESWDGEKVYDYTLSDSNLKLKATDGLSADYDLTKQ